MVSEFYQKFREELTHILLKLLLKAAEEGKLPNSFYKATITLIPKADKDVTEKEKYKTTKNKSNITGKYRCKSPQLNSSKQNPTIH